MIARKTNGERTTGNMTCRGEIDSREGGRGKGTRDEKSRYDRRKDEWKKGSESRCDQTEVNNKDDDRKKRDRQERNNRDSGRGKSQQPGRCKTEELLRSSDRGGIENRKGIYKTLHFAKDRQDIKQRRRRCCLSTGARIEHVTERVENVLGHGQGGTTKIV